MHDDQACMIMGAGTQSPKHWNICKRHLRQRQAELLDHDSIDAGNFGARIQESAYIDPWRHRALQVP